jgi:hypothetical protein
MNYKPVFIFAGGERCTNAQVFATQTEAYKSAQARFMVWTMPVGIDTETTTDKVTYKFTNQDERLK